MQLRVIAVGTRMPAWVRTALDDYGARLPAEFRIDWKEVKAEPRTSGGAVARWLEREAARIGEAMPPDALRVVLDERGRDLDTAGLADLLRRWREDGRPVAILIGGPDGLDASLKASANLSLRLSSLTLPHAMVRVLLAEQIFRAWSMLANHPYHRAGG